MCHCITSVDVTRLGRAFEEKWLSEETPQDCTQMYCTMCVESPSELASSKKGRSKKIFHLFKKKDDADGSDDSPNEELFLCLLCAQCFCGNHMQKHSDYSKHPTDSSPSNHTLFFCVPCTICTQGTSPRAGKRKSVFPTFTFEKESELGREKLNPLNLKQSNPSGEWAFRVVCTSCSDKPKIITSSDFDDSDQRHVCTRKVGYLLARLLFLFCQGFRSDTVGERRSNHQSLHMHTSSRALASRQDTEHTHHASSATAATHSGSFKSVRSDVEAIVRAHIAGIENVRNTCYFNSVLQCVLQCKFFTLPLMRLSESAVPGPLTQRIQSMIQHLKVETVSDLRTHSVYPHANAVLQQLCELNSMFAEDEQQDSQELFLTLINGVADEFDKNKSKEEIKRGPRISFEGELRTEVECQQCKNRLYREEMFMALSVPVEESVERGLAKLFRPMHLTGKDKYACEKCFSLLSKEDQERHNAAIQAENEKKDKCKRKSGAEEKKSLNCVYSDAFVRTSINRMGGTLALHLLRFQYDGHDFQKVTQPVSFPLCLNLSPFVSTDVLEEYRRKNALPTLCQSFPGVAEKHLERILKSTDHDLLLATQKAHDALQSGDMDGNDVIGQPSSSVEYPVTGTAVSGEEVRRVLSPLSPPNPTPSLERRLVGIVTHRGSLHGGHYIAFVRSGSKENLWFRCDDEIVEIVEETHVMNYRAEVYMLFYE